MSAFWLCSQFYVSALPKSILESTTTGQGLSKQCSDRWWPLGDSNTTSKCLVSCMQLDCNTTLLVYTPLYPNDRKLCVGKVWTQNCTIRMRARRNHGRECITMDNGDGSATPRKLLSSLQEQRACGEKHSPWLTKTKIGHEK